MLEALPGRYALRPEFAELVDPEGHWHTPYTDTAIIIYNPELIKKEDVPTSWAGLADFDQQVAVPARGCSAMRTLSYLYHIVGEDKFGQIVTNGKIPPLTFSRDDKRDKEDYPLSAGGAVKAVLADDIPIGIGLMRSAELRQCL